MSYFNNKIVWITGASSGIGEALSYAMAQEGARLILSARREDELIRVQNNCKKETEIMTLPLDLSDSASLAQKTQVVLAHFGKIDILINNGGISQRSLGRDTELSVYRQLMEVNFFGTIALTKSVLPSMLSNKDGQIAVVSSIAGKIGTPLRTGYSASKFALQGFFDALRVETMDENIHITMICPGSVQTNVSKNALTGDGSAQNQTDELIANGLPVEDCVAQIMDALKNQKDEVLIGNQMELGAVTLSQSDPNQLKTLLKGLITNYKLV